MPRYIDADKVMDEINRIGGHNLCEWETIGVKALIDRQPTADVVPKSEEGAECPTCYGTGRIGTTNWLTKNMTKKQIAEEKAKAIAEHEQHIKADVAREIFEDIQRNLPNDFPFLGTAVAVYLDELKKKYTGEEKQ